MLLLAASPSVSVVAERSGMSIVPHNGGPICTYPIEAYTLVCARSSRGLDSEVTEHLLQGWLLYGPVEMDRNDYCQPMVKLK